MNEVYSFALEEAVSQKIISMREYESFTKLPAVAQQRLAQTYSLGKEFIIQGELSPNQLYVYILAEYSACIAGGRQSHEPLLICSSKKAKSLLQIKAQREAAPVLVQEDSSDSSDIIGSYFAEHLVKSSLGTSNRGKIYSAYNAETDKNTPLLLFNNCPILLDQLVNYNNFVFMQKLDLQQKYTVWRNLCATVASIHRAGLSVSNKLKPANVSIHPKSLDTVIMHGVLESAKTNEFVTQFSQDSPCFASPEMLDPKQNRPDSNASDIFILGIWACFIFGKLPFCGSTKIAVQRAILTEDAILPALPTEIIGIVSKCLQKSPKQRYANATELLQQLEKNPVTNSSVFCTQHQTTPVLKSPARKFWSWLI